jgi:hypothetical protein
MLKRLKAYFFPERLREFDQLVRFVSGEASYVAQRSTYEFARNTLAWFGQDAFGDDKFNEVFAVCRWEAFARIAADMVMVVRADLATANTDRRLDPGLLRLYGGILGEYPHPVHRPEGWHDCHQSLLSRLAAIPPEQRPDLKALGAVTGRFIHEQAPARGNHADEERAVLAAAVTFGLISFSDRVGRQIAVDDIALALSDRAS